MPVARSDDTSIFFDEIAGQFVAESSYGLPAIRPLQATFCLLVEVSDCASPGIWNLGAELEEPIDHETGDRSLLSSRLSVPTLATDRIASVLHDLPTVHFSSPNTISISSFCSSLLILSARVQPESPGLFMKMSFQAFLFDFVT